MNASEIHEKLTAVFRDVFDDPALVISATTNASEIEQWDSLTHVDLIVAVEKAFQTSFTTKDVKSLDNVGDLMRLIANRVR
jgi:acyl carrier protein